MGDSGRVCRCTGVAGNCKLLEGDLACSAFLLSEKVLICRFSESQQLCNPALPYLVELGVPTWSQGEGFCEPPEAEPLESSA